MFQLDRRSPSVRGSASRALRSVCEPRRLRVWPRCIHPVFLKTSGCDQPARRASAVPLSPSPAEHARAAHRRAAFPPPEYQKRADRTLSRSQRASGVWLLSLFVVFLGLCPGSAKRLIAAIPLSLFTFSSKDQGQCFEW